MNFVMLSAAMHSFVMLSNVLLHVVMLSVFYAEFCYTDFFRYTECCIVCYDECSYIGCYHTKSRSTKSTTSWGVWGLNHKSFYNCNLPPVP